MNFIEYVVASSKEEAERIRNESYRIQQPTYQGINVREHGVVGILRGKFPGFEYYYVGNSAKAKSRAKKEGKNVYRRMPDKTWHKLRI
jgi:hypothetical protein